MKKEKFLNEVALFVQELLQNGPMEYEKVREKVMKKFTLSKTKAGNVLHLLKRRENFLSYSFSYDKLFRGVLYLPEHSSEARKLFVKIRDSIPKHIRYVNKRLHKYLLHKTRKIVLQNKDLPARVIVEIVRWRLKVSRSLAKKLVEEVI